MASLIKAADTRFSHPAFDEWNPASQLPQGGRLLSDGAHVDGMLFATGGGLESSSSNLVWTRNGASDWSLNRTASGAETYYVRANLADMAFVRTGETQIIDDIIEGGFSGKAMPDKGLELTDVFVVWGVGVAALTSATLRFSKVQYPLPGAAAAAPSATDILAATAVPSLVTNTNYVTQKLAIATGSQVFNKADLAEYELELAFVMANTGTIKLAGIGCHFNFNFN